jgi:hypothetical protein
MFGEGVPAPTPVPLGEADFAGVDEVDDMAA